METIYHIMSREEWATAREAGVYIPESLSTDGFIHAGFRAQLLDVANALFRGEQDLVVLCIDPSRVTTEIREDLVEFPEGRMSPHPHFYGPLNIDAVLRVVNFAPEPDGSFQLPRELI